MYYILKDSLNSKVIGSQFPQVQDMSNNYNYDASNSVSRLCWKSNRLLDFEPNLNSFVLHNNSIKTDLISTSVTGNCGLLISTKLKSIFEKYKLPIHRYYHAKLIHKNENDLGYFWIHIVSDYTDFVDYSNSEFYVYDFVSSEIGAKISIDTKATFLKAKKEINDKNEFLGLTALKIRMKSKFIDEKLDLFKVSLFDFEFHISISLQKAINEGGITGIDFVLARNLIL